MKHPYNTLIGIRPDGRLYAVGNEYEVIRSFIGAPIDFMYRGKGRIAIGMYINDEGMIDPQQELNWAASLLVQYPVYGSAIVCAAEADGDGDTVPLNDEMAAMVTSLATMVEALHVNAKTVGQELILHPNPDTVPPPTITTFDEAEFDKYMRGDRDDIESE